MAGINSGILNDAYPLSSELIKQLEEQVLQGSNVYAYFDENGELCFSLPQGVDSIKELAWHNAYELSAEQGNFIKKAYKKNGLKSFYLDKTLRKSNIDDAWSEQPDAERLEGDGQEFYTLAPSTLSFRSSAPLNELKEVQINGQTVDPSNYTLEEGSTIVTFLTDYLKNFDKGNYKVTVESENKTVSGNFTVVEPELNEYGFYYNIPYYNNTDNLGLFLVVFKDNGTIIYKDVMFATTKYGSYVMEGNNIVGTLDDQPVTFELRADGIYSENVHSQAPLLFNLNSLYGAADDDYIYFCDTAGEFYYVCVLNTELTSFDGMKTTINNYPVTTLAWGALQDCDNIIDLVIPNHITRIDANVCGTNSKIHSVVIPDNVKNVAWGAFNDCLQLTDIEIGKGVTNIGPVAFGYCPNLKNVTYKGTTQQWLNVSFTYDMANSFHKTLVSWVRCSDGRVSIFNGEVDNTTPTKNEYGFYYDVPYTFATTVEDAGDRIDMLMHAVIKADGTFENYTSVPQFKWNGRPDGSPELDNIWSYNDGVLTILGQVPLKLSDDGLSLTDVTGALGTFLNVSEQVVLTCTFEDYHDIYFGATYNVHPAFAGADFKDMILNADGSATDIYGYSIAPVGAITYAPHTITMGELSGLVSMDGTTIFVDMQPIWSTFDHICKFVNQSTNSEYLAEEATCQSPAKYYYSCICGAKGTETFEYGEIGEHNYVDTVCTICGDVHECDYTRKYQWDEYLVSEATCTQPAVYKYQCEHGVKGIETFIGDSLKPHNYVDTVCTVCGAKQPGLYETGSDYTVLLKTWDELKENDMVLDVSISDTHVVSASYAGRETLAGDLILPDTTTDIRNISGQDGFTYCDQLTGIIIPDSVTSICRYAFAWCSSLTNAVIGNSVTSISVEAFRGCSSLTDIEISDSVTSIGDNAFRGCYDLKSVTIGSNVTHIGDGAFDYCDQIASITFNGTMAQWRAISKGASWYSTNLTTYVQCTDGQVSL